jgi:hypothetical protein
MRVPVVAHQISAVLHGLMRGVSHLSVAHKGTMKSRSSLSGLEAHIKYLQPSVLSFKTQHVSEVRSKAICTCELILRFSSA